MNNRTIRTHTIDECNELILLISCDDKTNYTEKSFEVHPDFMVDHLVLTSHNKLNFKRKYNSYEIIQPCQ